MTREIKAGDIAVWRTGPPADRTTHSAPVIRAGSFMGKDALWVDCDWATEIIDADWVTDVRPATAA